MDTGGQPDLQSILATLAQHAPASPHVASNAAQSDVPQRSLDPACSGQGTAPKDPPFAGTVNPQGRPGQTPARPMIDPSTITAWPDALRCITKIAAQNVQFAAGIKKVSIRFPDNHPERIDCWIQMIKEQRAHEMRWYTERQNLKQTQANRAASAAKAQSILKSLNTGLPGSSVDQTAVDPESELAAFDCKIYTAQQHMETAMSAELKALGVPFFGTDQTLVVSDGTDPSEVQVTDDRPKWSPLVTESHLFTLRRRMVQHLEDLYRE